MAQPKRHFRRWVCVPLSAHPLLCFFYPPKKRVSIKLIKRQETSFDGKKKLYKKKSFIGSSGLPEVTWKSWDFRIISECLTFKISSLRSYSFSVDPHKPGVWYIQLTFNYRLIEFFLNGSLKQAHSQSVMKFTRKSRFNYGILLRVFFLLCELPAGPRVSNSIITKFDLKQEWGMNLNAITTSSMAHE